MAALIADPISYLDNGTVEETNSRDVDSREDKTVDLVHMAMAVAFLP